MTEMVTVAGRIAASVDVPVIADADSGFGNELNAARTVRAYERAGVAAIHIEDQTFPKSAATLKTSRSFRPRTSSRKSAPPQMRVKLPTS